jgi:hypothetical protein
VQQKGRGEQSSPVSLLALTAIRGTDDKHETPESDKTVDDVYLEDLEAPAEATPFEIKKKVRYVSCSYGCNQLISYKRQIRVHVS